MQERASLVMYVINLLPAHLVIGRVRSAHCVHYLILGRLRHDEDLKNISTL